MTRSKMKKDDPVFLFVEQLVRSAIKKNIELDSGWEIAKVYFEDRWEPQRFHESVEEVYGLQVSDVAVDVDLAEDDDVESLTNCYVTIGATGPLAAALREHGVQPQVEVDVFNSAIGSSVALLDDDDVEDQVSLLHLWIDKGELLGGLIERLQRDFG